jgi:3-hydroxyisobutyrate dehydrogenase/2-hydroxy-3-oxopropionate reductase
MAGRIVHIGHDVTVWNRTPQRMDPLVAAGARRATSAADAARGADVVLTMLADPAALQAVARGPSGFVAGLAETASVVEMSTVGPAAITRLRAALPDRVGLLDAPVLGSLAEAEAGTLQMFVGGPADLVDTWTPLLSTMGTPTHVGPLGCGAAAKLVANSTLFGVLAVLGEALALADGLGLPRETAYRVLATTPVGTQAQRRRTAVESGAYPPRFSLSLARKDADLVVAAARTAGVDVRLAAAARSWLADADAAGLGAQDYSAVLAQILSRQPGSRA